jgi:hypothetical protein
MNDYIFSPRFERLPQSVDVAPWIASPSICLTQWGELSID